MSRLKVHIDNLKPKCLTAEKICIFFCFFISLLEVIRKLYCIITDL